MSENVVYTTRWNLRTRRHSPDHVWLSPDAARDLATDQELVVAVDATAFDKDGIPLPKWKMGFRIPGRVRVSFFNQSMSLWRQVDWDWIDGKLWRWITCDFTYPDNETQWSMRKAILSAESIVHPNGAGEITLDEKSPRRTATHQFTGRASNSYWLDFPEFGDWGALAAPGPSAYEVAGLDAAGPDALDLIEQGDA